MIEIENLMLKLENKTGCCGSLFIGLDRDGKNVHRFVNAVSQERALEVLQAVVNELTPKIENATVDIQEIPTPQTEPSTEAVSLSNVMPDASLVRRRKSARRPADKVTTLPTVDPLPKPKSRASAKAKGSLKS